MLKSSSDNLDIAVVVKRPKVKPVAVIQFVHGMCGCKERFEPTMDFLAGNGIVCIASDLRGHGESIRDIADLGYFYSGGYKALVEDLRVVTNWALKEFGELPYYLLGHSMGSLAARIYAKQDDSALSGLILCGSPSWNPISVVGRFLTGIGCLIGLGRCRIGFMQNATSYFYNRRFASEGEQAWLCSDPEVRKCFRENPRCNFKFTMNGANNLLKMMRETYSSNGWNVFHPVMPIIFISGLDDPCMISQRKLYKAAKSLCMVGYKNVSFCSFPKMRHEVLNEKNKHIVWNEILNFITIQNDLNFKGL